MSPVLLGLCIWKFLLPYYQPILYLSCSFTRGLRPKVATTSKEDVISAKHMTSFKMQGGLISTSFARIDALSKKKIGNKSQKALSSEFAMSS